MTGQYTQYPNQTELQLYSYCLHILKHTIHSNLLVNTYDYVMTYIAQWQHQCRYCMEQSLCAKKYKKKILSWVTYFSAYAHPVHDSAWQRSLFDFLCEHQFSLISTWVYMELRFRSIFGLSQLLESEFCLCKIDRFCMKLNFNNGPWTLADV